jgi:hypothetical protein
MVAYHFAKPIFLIHASFKIFFTIFNFATLAKDMIMSLFPETNDITS